MALNPIALTERVVADFLRYQVTTYPFADERLYRQLRDLLSLGKTRRTPLLRGPYVSLSRAYRIAAAVGELAREGLLHPFLERLVEHPRLFGHQETAIRRILAGHTTLISTGTGSGKTECFLYPIISRCLHLRDAGAPPGIVAVLVYPMNALAEDQLGRLRGLLAGTGVPFGMYVGKTPDRRTDVAGERLRGGTSREAYARAFQKAQADRRGTAVHPPEERVSREEMQERGGQPRILLTNVKQLELLLTRHADVGLFEGALLEHLVFDEAHTYTGVAGAEAACLVRRLRAYCGREASETVCVGTSATLADPERGLEAAREFAARFFGVASAQVEVVGEEHAADEWADVRRPDSAPPAAAAEHLQEILAAVEAGEDAGSRVAQAWRRFTGDGLSADGWESGLYDRLRASETCFRLARALAGPTALATLAEKLTEELRRPVTEEEILAWLALGAAARREGRPFLRPVVHAFVRGVGGGVVTFPPGADGPSLALSGAEREADAETPLHALPVLACNTCGQHYFEHHVADLRFTDGGLDGGEAVLNRKVWKSLDAGLGGVRVLLVDRLVSAENDEDDEPLRAHEVFLCPHCAALHPGALDCCDGCGRAAQLVRLFAAGQVPKHPGRLVSCLACRAPGRDLGGRYREPIRPVRAVTVADVHVLAQNLIHHAERRRLLVFADNRQDAAFQAGWMRDHARRFRMRALMAGEVEAAPLSLGDLTARLDALLEVDPELSRALVPEVWSVARPEAAGLEHARERKRFLRIQVLREIATGVKQRVGLEPWGRLRVEYLGLEPALPLVRDWAARLGLEPERLVDGIGAILDAQRRTFHLLDRSEEVFSRFWHEGDREVMYGYLPLLRGVPKGLKLERAPDDDKGRLTQWWSTRGDTAVRQAARAFGVGKDDLEEFVRGLWALLADERRLLAPVTLKGQRGGALPHCTGAWQIDGDRLLIARHRGRWRCATCRRTQVRPTPHDRCLAWRCNGVLRHEADDPDNYDLAALEQGFAMLRPAEHSAQVPADERERLERRFKGKGEEINTLVCTPTLEMGVDIGGLDTILMRNVPPLPSNYWQRAGRAGRRHRLAVNLTYARTVAHDRAYFAEPLKLLAGRVEPPRFNLKNEVMLAKHVRAAVLTRLEQLALPAGGLGQSDRDEIRGALDAVFPTLVRGYLFEPNGELRTGAFDVRPLHTVVTKHADDLVGHVEAAFRRTWPAPDAEVVTPERLRATVLGAAEALGSVLANLGRRLRWCLDQMRRLEEERRRRGTLDPDEDALYRRCDRMVKRLKGVERRRRAEAEGYDDTVTFGMLAAEGFLPGYGLETGQIVGTALASRSPAQRSDFDLKRPTAVALREYVPGNLIYANGSRFVPRYFHLEAVEPLLFQVDVGREALLEAGTARDEAVATLGAQSLRAVPVCDVELAHVSQITDEEEYRFQMSVATYGHELGRHGSGVGYDWGGRELLLRRGVHLRLVNVGPTVRVREGRLGYPLSLVSGQSRSPFASAAEIEAFTSGERERYGRAVDWIGFYADVVAEALTLQGCPGREEAYSILEALRVGMAQVLEMDRDDLELLVIGRPGTDMVDGLLYDPMPGGSGLLLQACARWAEVVAAALEAVRECPADCARSCIDCLQTFRNAFFHAHLDRRLAAARVAAWGRELITRHDIPPRMPAAAPRGREATTNQAETRLRGMLTRAGLPEPRWQHRILLGAPLGATTPDAFYEGDDDADSPICIYLDGLSDGLHGKPETAARDRRIRDELRARGHEVFEIAATELDDREAMTRHLFRLARFLMGREKARAVKTDGSWFPPDGS